MEEKEVKLQLEYLISKYIENDKMKEELIDIVKKRGGSVAKGVLADIQGNKKGSFDKKDSEIIKDIVFYYV